MRLTVILLFLFVGVVSANEDVIPEKAPLGIESLVTEIQFHEAPENMGAHDLVEYCYQSNDFVVYSTNVFGHGYQLSKMKPENLKCVIPNKDIVSKNKLGMYIGMPKSEVQKLLGNIHLKDNQTIIWQSKVAVNDINYDLQTYAEFKFSNNLLVWLSVFTTETN